MASKTISSFFSPSYPILSRSKDLADWTPKADKTVLGVFLCVESYLSRSACKIQALFLSLLRVTNNISEVEIA